MARASALYDHIRKETCYSRAGIRLRLSDDYIRGLIEGEGCFGNQTNGKGQKVPVFMLKMHVRDKELIEAIRDYLGLPDRVHEYRHQERHYALLQVRDLGSLKNTVIPLFRGRLLGHKGTQFEAWFKQYPYLWGPTNTRFHDKHTQKDM